MRTVVVCCAMLLGCNWGPWKRDNEKKRISMTEKLEIISTAKELYCEKALENYFTEDRFHGCDSALFAGLLGAACGFVDISAFEHEKTGRMCRDWECSCWDEANSVSGGSDSDYSKDMNTGVQHYMAAGPDKKLMGRIVDYLESSNLVMCQSEDTTTQISKCVMPPNTYFMWQDMLSSAKLTEHHLTTDVYGKVGFTAHLAVIGILTEGLVYGGISDVSVKELKGQAERENENALYVAAHALYDSGNMEKAADLWLSQCPIDRLPNTHDYCTDYRYQRDRMKDGEINPDWVPCPEEDPREHPGVDCAFAAHIILGG